MVKKQLKKHQLRKKLLKRLVKVKNLVNNLIGEWRLVPLKMILNVCIKGELYSCPFFMYKVGRNNMDNYDFTNEQIENRVLADCNRKRLKEHRQCDYCHLVFDCKVYNKRKGISLCRFLDDYKE